VQVEPSPLDVAAHHVDAAVGRVAVARGELFERPDVPVAVLVFALAGEKDLLAGLPLQLVDVRPSTSSLSWSRRGLSAVLSITGIHSRSDSQLPNLPPRSSLIRSGSASRSSLGQALVFVAAGEARAANTGKSTLPFH
jgi:hypothetical protein